MGFTSNSLKMSSCFTLLAHFGHYGVLCDFCELKRMLYIRFLFCRFLLSNQKRAEQLRKDYQ